MSRKIILVLVILTNYLPPTFAQNLSISFENPSGVDALVVCDSTSFQVSLTNSSNVEVSNILLTVQFPAGVFYNTGTVTNATDSDLSDLNAPVFSVPNLAPSEVQNITFFASADCSLVDAINDMQLFFNSILVSYDGGSNNVLTTPYNIETPLLILANTGVLIQNGIQGDVLFRSFSITNTRLGALQSFTFRDEHEGGIEISSALGTDISTQDNVFELLLEGADFTTIGDGDDLFELDETITIVEEIFITSCGQPLSSTTSNINAVWGCNNTVCQSTTTIEAYIGIEVAYLEPELTFTPFADSIPKCYCTGEPIQHGLTITNNSAHAATSIEISLSELNIFAGIDPTSFTIDSSDFISPIADIIADTIQGFESECNISIAVNKDSELTIPIVDAGESITLYWDVYVCALDCSRFRNSTWSFEYTYFSICPPVPKITGEGLYFNDGPSFISEVIAPSSDPLLDGSISTFEYLMVSNHLLNDAEELTITFELPCGMNWPSDNEIILDGQPPSSTNINATDTITYITATYSPPFSNDSISLLFDVELICANICEELLCKDTIISSCADYCASDIPTGLLLNVIGSLQLEENCPAACNLNTCAAEPIPIDCDPPICEEFIPGYAEYSYSAFRTNYGLADNNDDRIADLGGVIDLSLINRNRLIAGDTVQLNVNSIVRIDEAGYSFPAGQLLVKMDAIGLSGLNLPLFLAGGILPLSQELLIYDNSSNTYHDCSVAMPLTINTVDTGGAFSFQFDISPSVLSNNGSDLPMDYEYEEGDSILFKQTFKIIHNLIPPFGSSVPPISTLNIIPEVYLLDENGTEPTEDWFKCDCDLIAMELSGFRYNIVSGIHAIPTCDTSSFVGGTLFSFLLGDENFFPFEHRSLGQLTDWRIELPNDFTIVESKLTAMDLQDDIPLFANIPLDPNNNNTTYQFDLLSFQTPELDEGFSILIQNRFLSNCAATGSYPLTIHARIEPAPNLGLPSIIDTSTIKPASLRMLNPNIDLDATFFNNTSYDDQAEWDFSLFNDVVTVASFMSGAAENVWVRPFSATGLVTDFQLTDANTGMSFPQINGIFQLGMLDTFSIINLHLTATNSSCAEELIELRFGWNCEEYNNPITTACSDKVAYFTVISPPAALEQTVESPIGTNFLCDTIDYYTINIFNANLGTAYNPTIEIQLPPGVYVIPGSSQISYPSDGTFLSVADPTDTGTGTLLWDISSLQDSIDQNGLPGFTFTPTHSFQIRFKLFTDCDFIAGSYPIMFADAKQVCGIPTNSLAEAAEPIVLDGLPPPYNSSISALSSDQPISCQDSISLEVNITTDEITLNGDSIFITLPSGIGYVSNSISGNPNASLQEPNVSINNNLQILKWPLIPGINPGDAIAFQFMVSGFAALECGPQLALLQTVGPASALCALDNSICDILIETGSNILQLNIDRASYGLSDLELTVTPSGANEIINFDILVANDGFLSQAPIILDFYIDSDGSGTWTPADLFFFGESYNNTIANGGNLTLSGSFTISAGQACDLIAVIDETKHCACSGDEQILTSTITYIIPDEVSLCSGESQTIGISGSPGATYQWTPETGLTCDECSTTEIDLTNTSNSTITNIYTLTEADGEGCVTAYQFTLVLQPEPSINSSNANLCFGDSILLQATDAASYFWTGPGISNPVNSSQLVSPTADAVYTVQLTDDFGCNGTDSIQVNVIEPPIAFAGNDTLFCESSIVQLQAFFDTGYNYEWAPAGFLDDPNSPTPTIINNTATTYSLTVTDTDGCQAMDQILVDFGAAPTLVGEVSTSICFGDSVLLSFNGALNYSWSPPEGLSCTNCPEPYASPEASTTYTLTGSDAIGCSSTVSVSVNLLSGSGSSEDMSLCEGDTILVFGQLVSAPGIYCDTMISQFTGCDSIHCIAIEESLEINTDEALVICEGQSIEINGTTYTTSGTYCNTMQTFAGCDSTHCLTLEVRANPVITILPEITIELGDTVALGPFPDAYSYSWSPSEGLSCDDCSNPLAFPIVDTEYLVMLTDSAGCNNEFTIRTRSTIPTCLPPNIFIPNAFTPNGDNENDVLRVYGNSIERLHLMIFNRWGEKVFETFEVDGFWDGTFNGKRLAPDVFGYYLELDCIGGERFVDKGNVTILK